MGEWGDWCATVIGKLGRSLESGFHLSLEHRICAKAYMMGYISLRDWPCQGRRWDGKQGQCSPEQVATFVLSRIRRWMCFKYLYVCLSFITP